MFPSGPHPPRKARQSAMDDDDEDGKSIRSARSKTTKRRGTKRSTVLKSKSKVDEESKDDKDGKE